MSEQAILNPTPFWEPALDDSIAPDFGYEMMRRSQIAIAKPAGGWPISRTIGNGGHSGRFSWMNRSRACIEKLKRFAEQHEDGYFTLIDHDADRHYVGNFVGDMPWSQAGNDRYNVQGWTFEEVPGAPMLQYPASWERWAVPQYPVDDYGRLRVATFASQPSAWGRPAPVVGDDGIAVVPVTVVNTNPTIADWIASEYRGYGFRLWGLVGPEYGFGNLYVNGIFVGYVSCNQAADLGPQILYENTNMPLGLHRVKIVLQPYASIAHSGPIKKPIPFSSDSQSVAASSSPSPEDFPPITIADTTTAWFGWDRLEVMR